MTKLLACLLGMFVCLHARREAVGSIGGRHVLTATNHPLAAGPARRGTPWIVRSPGLCAGLELAEGCGLNDGLRSVESDVAGTNGIVAVSNPRRMW